MIKIVKVINISLVIAVLFSITGCANIQYNKGLPPKVVINSSDLNLIKHMLIKNGERYGYILDNGSKIGYEIDLNDNKTVVLFKPASQQEQLLHKLYNANEAILKNIKSYRISGVASEFKNSPKLLAEKVIIYFIGTRGGMAMVTANIGLRLRDKNGVLFNYLDVTKGKKVYSELYNEMVLVKYNVEKQLY